MNQFLRLKLYLGVHIDTKSKMAAKNNKYTPGTLVSDKNDASHKNEGFQMHCGIV